MAPATPGKPLAHIPDEAYFRDPSRKVVDESLLSQHSGKVGLVALGMAAGMIWSFFKGNFNEKDAETEVAQAQAVDSAEVNEVRFNTKAFPLGLYDIVLAKSYARFPSGEAAYGEFVAFVLSASGEATAAGGGGGGGGALKQLISNAHLLDRIVWTHVLELFAEKEKNEAVEDIQESRQNKVDKMSTKLPVSFLLTVLNIAVAAPPPQRAAALFDVACIVDAHQEKQVNDDDAKLDSSDEQTTISVQTATVMVQHLAQSCQLPAVKQIKENTRYPLRTYRRKTAAEMVEPYVAARAGTERLGRDDFVKLILGKDVCAWGECYR